MVTSNLQEGDVALLCNRNGGACRRYRVHKDACGTLTVGEGVRFERIRRVTGYLVGTLDRFNNGKRAEERDRVKHTLHAAVTPARVAAAVAEATTPARKADVA